MWRKDINILTWGGLGDALLATPAIKALKQKYPERRLNVFCLNRHRDIFLKNPYVDAVKGVTFRSSPLAWILTHINRLELKSINYSFLDPLINYSKNIIEIIAEILEVELTDKQMQLFLTDQEIKAGELVVSNYKIPVTINPSAACSEHKIWPYEKWEQIIAEMPQCTFLQLGLNKDRLLKGALDLRGKSIRTSVAIVKSSVCYAGVDSFFAHAATAVNTPAVVLFGPSLASIYGHPQNINISKKLVCSPCMEVLMKSTCPYSRECMHKIEVAEVKTAIEKQINNLQIIEQLSMSISESF